MSSDGNTIAIGAPDNNGAATHAGQVRIYQWAGSAWNQKGGDINGLAAEDHLGVSVSMSSDGNTVAIGAGRFDGIPTTLNDIHKTLLKQQIIENKE